MQFPAPEESNTMRTDGDLSPTRVRPGPRRPAVLGETSLVTCLALVYPRDMQLCFKLGVAPRTIGSSSNADIVLNDDRIAPVHCRVSQVDGEVLVEDLGSTAGTWIDHRRIAGARLEPGQLLRVGHFSFRLGQRSSAFREVPERPRQEPGTDQLTGIPNRAWIVRRAERVLEARVDSPLPVTLALMALDGLDLIQRQWGYEVGDQMLRGVAHVLEACLRDKDILGLYTPERFLLLMPEVGTEEAQSRLDQLCRCVREQRFEHQGQQIGLTLSVGYVCSAGCDVDSLERLTAQADRALYQARNWGGGQVAAMR
jgi:diguanylate cyclase (GGDEF)-like protein